MYPFYYTRILEKLDIALLDMFNDLTVNKYKSVERKEYDRSVRIPIGTTTSNNFAAWYRNTQNKMRQLTPLPIAALRFSGLERFAAAVTQNTYVRGIYSKAKAQWIQDIQATPAKVTHTLDILCDNRSDMGQIIENIFPYFNPARTIKIKAFDFFPDIQQDVTVYMSGPPNIKFEDENASDTSDHQLITVSFIFTSEIDFFRTFELPEMIKYAEMNVHVGDFVSKMQTFSYPEPLAEKEKRAWEQLTPSIKEGFMLLKSSASTLVEEVDLDGKTYYKDVTVPEARRSVLVPSYKELMLKFNLDSGTVADSSGYNRDFIVLNEASRTFVPSLPGNLAPEGYTTDVDVDWTNILNWFGTNNGLMQSPYTFSIRVQFSDSPPRDTVFMRLVNKETTEVPAGEVWFEWGIIDSKLYYRFKTFGSDELTYHFQTQNSLILNNTDTYTFKFILYNSGHDGMFGYSLNGGSLVALSTERSM